MLQIKNLTITHRKDLRVILEDFHLTLNSGDKAVIIGEEGNGKSTLIKWIYEPDMAEAYTERTGERICTRGFRQWRRSFVLKMNFFTMTRRWGACPAEKR